MIVSCGTDIVEIERIKKAIDKWGEGFTKKIFTDKELAYSLKKRFCHQHLAARFAAKEAVFKAFGDGFHNGSWMDVEIVNNTSGKPEVVLHGKLNDLMREKKVDKIVVSMSHAKLFAQAIAILLRGEK